MRKVKESETKQEPTKEEDQPPEPKAEEHKEDNTLTVDQALNELFNKVFELESKLRRHQHNDDGVAHLPPEAL